MNHDWSDFNCVMRFKSIRLDPKKYCQFKPLNYNRRFDNLVNALTVDTERNGARLDVQRRMRYLPAPAQSRLAFPVLDKYTTYRDYSTGDFYCKLFNICAEHGFFEPKLLINHALFTPWWQSIFEDDIYKVDLKIDKSVAALFHDFNEFSVSHAELDTLKVYAHKTTTPGPPFSFASGRFYDNNDFLMAVDSDLDKNINSAFRKDFSEIKKSYYERLADIHFRQVDLAKLQIENLSQKQIMDAYFEGALPCAVKGYRKNSMDTPINIAAGDKAKTSTQYYTKDRSAILFQTDAAYSLTVDNKRVTNDLVKLSECRWGGSATIVREIMNSSWSAQVSAAVSSRMNMTFIEESTNGFASTRENSVYGYKQFLDKCTALGLSKFNFLNGDRSKAESFVTTNYAQFRELIHPKLRFLYDYQNTSIVLNIPIYAYQGLPSGVARTTEMNWLAGTYEALYTISELIHSDIKDVAAEYFSSLKLQQPFFIINNNKGKHVIKLFMCTDDIPLIIVSDYYIDAKLLEKFTLRSMKWNLDYEKMSTFGMTFTKQSLSANEVSIISKLFYSENPGFFVKDCFSIFVKLGLLDQDLRRDILKLLQLKYGVDYGYYQKAGSAFLDWLKRFGIPISEVVDTYSPAGKIIYGKFTSKDKLLESSRVPAVYLKPIFNYYKEIYNVYT